MNPFRLKSNNLFDRIEEASEEPLRIVFLSVEGNKTEVQYFEYIQKFRSRIGIKMGVHIHPLRRANKDNLSAPEQVLELLEEYLEIRNTNDLPERLRTVIPETYSYDFIYDYVNNPQVRHDQKTKQFEALLQQVGIDISYRLFLKEYKGENEGANDIFGIVIDRDYKSHSVSQMKNVVEYCKIKGYKCYITTPLFEFWLLMHLVDIKNEFPEDEEKFRVNAKCSGKHTFTSSKVSAIGGHNKSINEKVFLDKYVDRIDFAISQVKKNYTMDLDRLIGDETTEQSKMGELGTNIPELFELLK